MDVQNQLGDVRVRILKVLQDNWVIEGFEVDFELLKQLTPSVTHVLKSIELNFLGSISESGSFF